MQSISLKKKIIYTETKSLVSQRWMMCVVVLITKNGGAQ